MPIFCISSIYTNYVKINEVIVLLMSILKNFPSIVYDHIVFLIIIDLQLKNLIFFVFNFAILPKLYENVHRFVPRHV